MFPLTLTQTVNLDVHTARTHLESWVRRANTLLVDGCAEKSPFISRSAITLDLASVHEARLLEMLTAAQYECFREWNPCPRPKKSNKKNNSIKKVKDESPVEEFRRVWNSFLQSQINKVIHLARGFMDVLAVHFERLPKQKTLLDMVERWFCLAMEDKLEDYYKFQSCYLLSLVTKQDKTINEMPEKPDWLPDKAGFLIGGWFYRYARKCVKADLTQQVLEQFYAVCNVKRAGLAISKKKITKSLLSHQRNMRGAEFAPRPVQIKIEKKGQIQDRTYEPEDVLERINKRLFHLMALAFYRKDLRPKWRAPSNSACFEHSKKDGGSHALFQNVFSSWSPEFIGYVTYKTRAEPVYVPYIYQELESDLWSEMTRMMMDEERTKIAYKPSAEVHVVLEPFKARIITAGPGKLYQAGRCLQKPIHTALRQMDIFRLIGEPISLDVIRETYEGFLQIEKEGTDFDAETDKDCRSFMVAGDYSSATDGMHPSINQAFCKLLPWLETKLERTHQWVLEKCMAGHVLHYGQTEINDKVVEQTHGQLMGSPISFPVLCLANAAALWVSADIYYQRKLSFDELTAKFLPLFNGDDTCFASNTVHYEIWRNVTSCAGLNSSLGKSYCSDSFIMINSEAFFLKQLSPLGVVTEISDCFVLNPGLIKGQAKVLADSRSVQTVKDEDLLPTVDQFNKLKSKAPESVINTLEATFISHVVPKLKQSCRSWNLPRWLGGLGLNFGTTNFSQKKVAAALLMNRGEYDSYLSLTKTVPEYTISHKLFVNGLYDRLGAEKTTASYGIKGGSALGELDLSLNFIGGEPTETGCERMRELYKKVLARPYINAVSDELIGHLKMCDFIPASLVAPVKVGCA